MSMTVISQVKTVRISFCNFLLHNHCTEKHFLHAFPSRQDAYCHQNLAWSLIFFIFIFEIKLSEFSSLQLLKTIKFSNVICYTSWQVTLGSLSFSMFSKIIDVLDLHFLSHCFRISLFCCNSRTVWPRTINFGIHVYVDKGTYNVKFEIINIHLHLKATLSEFYCFTVYNLAVWKVHRQFFPSWMCIVFC